MNYFNILRVLNKKLPKPIKVPLRKAYFMYNTTVQLDDSLVSAVKGYFNLDEKEVKWLLKWGGRLNGDFWKLSNPKTEKEIEDFYKHTPFYIFDLAWWHMTRFQRVFRKKIYTLASGAVLEYGGGIGDFCVRLKKQGLDVDYADVEGKTFDFARYLFKKENLPIAMINLSTENIVKKYDTIFCIDVIEHVPDAKKVLDNLVNHLNNKGKLVITGLKINEESHIHPMHLKVNFDESYPESIGLTKTDLPWLFVKR